MYDQLLRNSAATCNKAAAEQKDSSDVHVLTQDKLAVRFVLFEILL